MRYILGHVYRYVLRWIFRHFQKTRQCFEIYSRTCLKIDLKIFSWTWPLFSIRLKDLMPNAPRTIGFTKGSGLWPKASNQLIFQAHINWFIQHFLPNVKATIDYQLAQHTLNGLFGRFGPFTKNVSLSRLYFFHQMSDEQWIK